MNKWIELLLGLILVIAPILIAWYSQMWGAWNFWSAAGTFFKGGLFWFVIMIGLLFILLGISDLKESGKSRARPMQRPPQHTMPQTMHAQMQQPMPVLDMTSQNSEKPAKKRKK